MAEMSLAEVTERLHELDKKVQIADDIEQIKKLMSIYQNAHTMNDHDTELECFWEDATLAIGESHPPMVGKEEYLKFVKPESQQQPTSPIGIGSLSSEPQIPTAGHFIVHPIIDVNGNKASGTWLQYCLHSDNITMHMLFWVQGIYTIEYEKRNGKWKFSLLKWLVRSKPHDFPKIIESPK